MKAREMKVLALIVTYNRKELLSECLETILKQSCQVDKILLIDNASTDGTDVFLKDSGYIDNPLFTYKKMQTNTGGSGGFYEGMKECLKIKPDWIWLMDDDTIPTQDCLEKLINAQKNTGESVSFFASCVVGTENEPMNVPAIDFTPTENGYCDWYFRLDRKLIKISSATFVSLLINFKAVEKCGLPCKDYFIWGDDSEYTMRLTKYYGEAFLVGDSKVIHKRKGSKTIDILNEDNVARINNYFYYYRNNIINERYYNGKMAEIKSVCKYLSLTVTLLFKSNGFKKSITVFKGIIYALSGYSKFENYIDSQLRDS